MQVPAVARGRNVICGTVGAMPWRAWRTVDGITGEVDAPAWLSNPDPRYSRLWVIAQTLDDLIFHGRAYWLVESRDALGFPASFQYLQLDRVGWWNPYGADHARYNLPPELGGGWRLTVDGHPVADRDVVRFDAYTGTGVLDYGAREIRTALALSDAARRFSSVELPAAVLRDLGPGMDDVEIDKTLAAWENARRSRTTAYLSSSFALDTDVALDPVRLQLIEARQQSAVEVARLLNISPSYVGASMGEGNMTYQNVESQRRELVDVTLAPWIAGLEQRLSMDDVTARGTQVRIDVEAFTRSTSLERWNAYQTAFNIVDPATGERALTVAEIRDRETFGPPGTTATPQAPNSAAQLTQPQAVAP